ncbi:MAG: archaeal heat shock protein Hsp20 [Candidatus Altiarchaeota archaeon]
MDDEDKPRRRRPFDDFFGGGMFGFDEDFERMHEHMNRIIREAMAGVGSSEMHPGKNYVYGFSMHSGPDGKPILNEFGNVPRRGDVQVPGEREPLVDVIDGKDKVTVIAEIPGVSKEDIELNASEKSLEIKVNDDQRRYHKELKLPSEILQEDVKATYKNGILEVKMKRLKPKEDSGKKKIKVE